MFRIEFTNLIYSSFLDFRGRLKGPVLCQIRAGYFFRRPLESESLAEIEIKNST